MGPAAFEHCLERARSVFQAEALTIPADPGKTTEILVVTGSLASHNVPTGDSLHQEASTARDTCETLMAKVAQISTASGLAQETGSLRGETE